MNSDPVSHIGEVDIRLQVGETCLNVVQLGSVIQYLKTGAAGHFKGPAQSRFRVPL